MKRRNENQHLQVLRHGRQLEKDGVPTPGSGMRYCPTEEFKYFKVLFRSDGQGEWEIDSKRKSKGLDLLVVQRPYPQLL